MGRFSIINFKRQEPVIYIDCILDLIIVLFKEAGQMLNDIKKSLKKLWGFQGVVEFLDKIHMRLSSAPNGEKDFYNRKGFLPIQVQVSIV